jgi:HEAT repeat protein
VKGFIKMLATTYDQQTQVANNWNNLTSLPLIFEIPQDREINKLLSKLSPDTPWGDRQIAAKKLGSMRSQDAIPGLLAVLPTDPFWMVRCSIIQALEMIGSPEAIPTLKTVAKNDGFQVVRSYATKAIERLSQAGYEKNINYGIA